MDVYHIWCNLKEGVDDVDFAERARAYLDRLRDQGALVGYRITRCKLGLRPAHMQEFHITLDFEDLAQLQAAFAGVASRADPIEELHHAVNRQVKDVTFALYRDFPDSQRVRGQERF
ncbi:MAG: DUF6614 family protein [Planctomycetota bacterium]